MNTTPTITPSNRSHTRAQPWRKHNMRGLTLVELLVAISLMLLITLGTIAIFMSSSQGHRTVDSSQQLDDSARFAFKVIGNAIRNAGYRDTIQTGGNLFTNCPANTPCPVLGFDNAVVAAADASNYGTVGGGVNNSDSLAIRFYGSGTAAAADGNMVTCTGQAVGVSDTDNNLGLSLFWVRNDNGEPALACTSRAGGARSTENILRGVESFQVMYGVDTDDDGIPNRFVSAANIADAAAWRTVKAVRVGMVLRGDRGSQQAASNAPNLYPLGQAFTADLAGAEAQGMTFVPPNDGRIRRVYTSTFMLRNPID